MSDYAFNGADSGKSLDDSGANCTEDGTSANNDWAKCPEGYVENEFEHYKVCFDPLEEATTYGQADDFCFEKNEGYQLEGLYSDDDLIKFKSLIETPSRN